MKIIKCRKCGTSMVSDVTMIENMMNEMSELNNKFRKTHNPSYVQEASQIKKIITQILHRNSQIEDRSKGTAQELAEIVHYIRTNNLITDEKLQELRDAARQRAAIRNEEDQRIINRLYGEFESSMTNRSKKDPTAIKAIGKK